ncbi:MAG: hypothetical protein AUJ72_05095 [Candidatus Omnitrophica bacterium CG1_02_46_14]|nr:MAG: hypothetical protein AUJ72_05095 [Candidatus Omnitrophica bacterium CG1_02_46_14]
MPHYAYKAKKGPSEIVQGVIEAASQEDAVDRLSDRGLLPVFVEETKGEAKPIRSAQPQVLQKKETPSSLFSKPLSLFGRIKSSEITIFSRQLASLLKAGVPILKSLWIISEQSENPRFKKVLAHAQEEVQNGKPLSAVLQQYPKLFPPIYIAMVRTGEDSGTLQETLIRVAIYRQRQEEILSRVRTAMAYPGLMAVTGAGTVIFMLTFVVPKLSTLFSNMGSKLPLPTRILIALSGLFHQKLLLGISAGAVIGIVLFLRFGGERAKVLWSRWSLKIPIVKDFILKAELARFSRTLELLIKSGIPILKSIEITAPVLKNTVVRGEFVRMLTDITGGGSLGKSMKQSKIFPLFMSNLVTVGEESGKLDEAMEEVANFYERETDESIRILTSLLEPLMILVMGAIVGFIVIAMLLPMFELNLAIK